MQPGHVTRKRLLSDVTDRSLRPKTRAVTARETAARFDSDSESLSKTKYFRKGRNLAPAETEITNDLTPRRSKRDN